MHTEAPAPHTSLIFLCSIAHQFALCSAKTTAICLAMDTGCKCRATNKRHSVSPRSRRGFDAHNGTGVYVCTHACCANCRNSDQKSRISFYFAQDNDMHTGRGMFLKLSVQHPIIGARNSLAKRTRKFGHASILSVKSHWTMNISAIFSLIAKSFGFLKQLFKINIYSYMCVCVYLAILPTF